jgi:hypothetical protein
MLLRQLSGFRGSEGFPEERIAWNATRSKAAASYQKTCNKSSAALFLLNALSLIG